MQLIYKGIYHVKARLAELTGIVLPISNIKSINFYGMSTFVPRNLSPKTASPKRRIQGKWWIFFFLLLASAQQAGAQAIHIDLQQTNLAKIVAALQQQAPKINFSYSEAALSRIKVDHVQLEAAKPLEALELLKKNYGLQYLQDGNNITLKYVATPAPRKGKTIVLSGTVTDDKNQPLSGVNVMDKDTHKGVVSGPDGKYTIETQEDAALTFSFVGYTAQTLTADSNTLDVRMKSDVGVLDEIVAVGYQKLRKSDLTGAVSSVKAKELNLTAPTVGQALVGKVAGVVVSQTDGSPYASTKIRVRGVGSINASSDPLYVIDGYPAGNDIFINPEDIETIDILKDAASAAIYGSRASGGVVLITTKKGKEGKGKLEYDFQVGQNELSKKIKLMNSDQFTSLLIDGRNNSYKDKVIIAGGTWSDAMFSDDNATRVARVGSAANVQIPTDMYDFANQKALPSLYNTDWQDALYRKALFTRHSLSFTGGSKTTHYAVSGGYQNQDGIVIGTGQKRINFRSNVDGEINKRLKVGANISYTSNTNQETQEGRWDHSPMLAALIYVPNFPVYQGDTLATNLEAAQTNLYGYQSVENPVALATRVKITRKGDRSTYNGFATYEFLKDLIFKVNLGTQIYSEKYDYYLPTNISNGIYAPYSAQSIAAATATAQTIQQKDQLAEFTLNYKKSIGKNHFTGLVGYTAQKNYTDLVSISAKGFQNDRVPEITTGATGQITVNSGTGKSTYTLVSYLGRIVYDYNNKYYLTGSFRTDGSSRFGPSNRWGKFPSISAGWNASKEDFYQKLLGDKSTLRLRASWGLSGNNSIGNYGALQTFNNPTGAVFGNNVISTAYYAGGIADNNLGWESTSQYNFGFDLGLFHDRLLIIANYYDSHTFNLLLDNNISAISGSSSIRTNLKDSKIRNRGVDVQIDGRIIRSKDFTFNASGNISINRNKVLDLGGSSTITKAGAERSYLTHITETGQPVGMFYGYKVAGMVRQKDMANIAIDDANYNASTQSFPTNYKIVGPARSASSTTPLQPGDLYFKDVNGDGVVNSSDLGIIGTPYPKFTYGFSMNAAYKLIDISASFNGSYGNQVLDGQDYYLYNMEGSGNQYNDVTQRYRSEAEPGNGKVYRADRSSSQSNSTRLSTFYLQSGSFLRCTDITLGYTLPTIGGLTKSGITNVRIYGSINNAFTITKYKGYNPEVDYNNGSNVTPGVDYGMYPLVKAYNLGVKLTF